MAALSAIVCTHNPREEYLRRTLEGLKAQTLPLTEWELLVVDNDSKEPVAGRFDISWHPNGRHVREEKTGLTPARLRGIAESKGDLLVFVDDDNVLRADYLKASRKIAGNYPGLGAWNGSCIPEFETEPPAELRPWLGGLIIEKLNAPIQATVPRGGPALPTGAGLSVRRNVALRYQEEVLRDPLRHALDRTGKLLGSGGDSDLALCGYALGLGAGRFPELELTHLISTRRLNLEYLEGLHEGFGYGGTILVAIHDRENLKNSRTSPFKLFLSHMKMLATGKSKAERTIKMAERRGRLLALQELKRSGIIA